MLAPPFDSRLYHLSGANNVRAINILAISLQEMHSIVRSMSCWPSHDEDDAAVGRHAEKNNSRLDEHGLFNPAVFVRPANRTG
jgi:hypothetical protein